MSLVEHGWRTFHFFDKIPAQSANDANEKFCIKFDVSFWADAGDYVLLGADDGRILRILDYKLWNSFKTRLYGFHFAANSLVCVGEDQQSGGGSPNLLLKCFDLSLWEGSSPSRKCCSHVALPKKPSAPPQPTSISTNALHTFVAIGFADSSVYFYEGNLFKDRPVLKFKALHETGQNSNSVTTEDGAVVGITVTTSVRNNAEVVVVFVVTVASVRSYVIEAGAMTQKILHNSSGCDPGCWYFSAKLNELVVAGREMVNFFDINLGLESGCEQSRCYALARGADKLQLIAERDYVLLLTQQKGGAINDISSSSTSIVVSVYDVEFRYIAFTGPTTGSCRLLSMGGEIFVLDGDGFLSRLVEKPLSVRLDILLKKNLFDVAIGLARRHKSIDLYNIYKQYGDYLYGRGDFDNSIRQYMATVGHIEPSYVIRKFLNGPRIAQLCAYLELVHQKGMAVDQHTNLLLGAYVKTNAVEKIVDFVEKSATPPFNTLDIDAAVKILRSSQFQRIAVKLAILHHRNDLLFDILIDDLKDYKNAMKFIETLPSEEAFALLELYGNVLIENAEAEFITLLKHLTFFSSVGGKKESIRQAMKIVSSHPNHLETVFGDHLSGEFADVWVRTALLEQRLHALHKQNIPAKSLPQEEIDKIFQLVDARNFREALHFAQIYKFSPLVIHIMQKQGRIEELLRLFLEEGDINAVIQCCGEDGLKNMWIEVITHAFSKEDLDPQHLVRLLDKATETNFVHPLVILEILSKKETAMKFGDTKECVMKWLNRQTKFIEENEVAIKLNEAKITEMKHDIDELESSAQVFQMSKCSACDRSLSIPAIHFLCKHSYHFHCFEEYNSDQSDQCPVCTLNSAKNQPDNRAKPADQRKLSSTQISYKAFRDDLEKSTDAIGFISQYVSQGIFNSNIGGGKSDS